MNCANIVGRTTSDPDVRTTQTTTIARFTVAVNRRKEKDGTQKADFISCVAFGKTAEFIEKYVQKGNRIGVVGRIQTGSYERDGQKIYTTDIVADTVELLESKNAQNGTLPQAQKQAVEPQKPVDEGITIDADELPF